MKDMINEVRNVDVFEQYIQLKEIISTFLESYKQNNSWKIRLIDSFIVFCAFTFIIQFLYVVVNGVYPMNSLLAGLICSIGSITLAGIINKRYFNSKYFKFIFSLPEIPS